MKSLEVYIGTSGWSYNWNPNGFEWYYENSKLNAVELNASFYRFPFPSMIRSWSRRGKIRWAIKVTRLVTHVYKFGEKSYATWDKFRKLFSPMEHLIDFYLFQLPPSAAPTQQMVERIESFYKKSELETRFALEWRNIKWFSERWVKWCENLGLTLVSLDSPEHPRVIFNVNGIVYLRIHGRDSWYSYCYSEEELEELVNQVVEAKPRKAYVFFNNNHDMLSNAQQMLDIFKLKGVKIA